MNDKNNTVFVAINYKEQIYKSIYPLENEGEDNNTYDVIEQYYHDSQGVFEYIASIPYVSTSNMSFEEINTLFEED